MNDRSAFVTVDGVEYELIFTTAAAKKIDEHCGGLEHAWDIIANAEKYTDKVNEILWFFVLLANQSILKRKLRDPAGKTALLTIECMDYLSSPGDYPAMQEAILEAMQKGTARDIHSEDDSKNTATG